MQKSSKIKAFTIIELLLVIVLIAILAVIILIALNPMKYFANTRNTTRSADIKEILNAVTQYSIYHNEQSPAGIDSDLKMIGTNATGCSVECGTDAQANGEGTQSDFVTSTQGDFDIGQYSSTEWSSQESVVQLTTSGISNGNGSYTSEIFDAGADVTWNTISWDAHAPYLKELPDNSIQENAYIDNNINMSGNVLLLHMNQSTNTMIDTSGNGNDGSYNGASAAQSGVFNTSLAFDGSNDRILVPNSAELNPSHITISSWFRLDPNAGSGGIVSKNSQYILRVDAQGRLSFAVYNPTWSSANMSWAQRITDTAWHHVVATYDGNTLKLYLDTNLMVSTNSVGIIRTGPSSIFIGLQASNYFDGAIDEIAIFNRSLTTTEINNMYTRAKQKIQIQVRSCDDDLCQGETFAGPDGTSGTYYSELNNSDDAQPSFAIDALLDNQYFQFKINYINSQLSTTPKISSISVTNLTEAPGETLITQDACLNLDPDLVSQYLVSIPYDPQNGDDSMTYYAIREKSNGRIEVRACNPELDKKLIVKR